MTDRVAQENGFGPLFFSLGLDELLTAVREAMQLTIEANGCWPWAVALTWAGKSRAARRPARNRALPSCSRMKAALDDIKV